MSAADDVRAIAVALHNVCSEHDRDPSQLLTAIAWTAVSACKSFEVSEDMFVEQFRKLMQRTGQLVDAPMLIRGAR